jgi:predicted DsbA family dithiol-disulfide isomerase
MADVIKVDVWSDIACPWCYIGKRRFEQGVREYVAAGGESTVEIEYHSFELSPDTPVDFTGSEVDFLCDFKGLSEQQVHGMLEQVTSMAAGEGLAYDFASLQHTKTIKAHQVLHLAKAHGLQGELKERLLRAYFTEGRHVGHDDDLADLAADVGLDRQEVLDALNAGTYLPVVEADMRQAIAYGINGVPFYVINDAYGVSGAQAPATFAQVLARADAAVTS